MEREIRIEESINLGESAGSPVYPELDPLEEAKKAYLKKHPSITLPEVCVELSKAFISLEEALINKRDFNPSFAKIIMLEAIARDELLMRGLDRDLVGESLVKMV